MFDVGLISAEVLKLRRRRGMLAIAILLLRRKIGSKPMFAGVALLITALVRWSSRGLATAYRPGVGRALDGTTASSLTQTWQPRLRSGSAGVLAGQVRRRFGRRPIGKRVLSDFYKYGLPGLRG